MNIERDKFLTEAMGECWHEAENSNTLVLRCAKCKLVNFHDPDFSSWEGFGKLWEWAQKQEWWVAFLLQNKAQVTNDNYSGLLGYIVNPSRFADAVYKFLKERGGK